MHLLWIISMSLLSIYLLRMLTYMVGWTRLKSVKAGDGNSGGVSVVIPVRNEESNLSQLLEDIVGQDYPHSHIEIIIADDHSVDKTGKVAQSYQNTHPNIRYVQLKSPENGKKAALHAGILTAKFPIILTTDGDCSVGKSWVSTMVNGLTEGGNRLIIGGVLFEPDHGIFRSMQSLEFFSLSAVTAGSAGIHEPILCNAANLAYYKEDYLEYKNEKDEKTVSGDDIFLMLWIKNRYKRAIAYLKSPGVFVRTPPADSMMAFWIQRMRWTSKSRHYRDHNVISTALLIYFVNAMLLGFILMILISPFWYTYPITELIFLTCTLFTLKCFIDLAILVPVLRFAGKTKLLRYFIPLEIIYLVYVSVIGLLGQFMAFSWKGRRIPGLKHNNSGD